MYFSLIAQLRGCREVRKMRALAAVNFTQPIGCVFDGREVLLEVSVPVTSAWRTFQAQQQVVQRSG